MQVFRDLVELPAQEILDVMGDHSKSIRVGAAYGIHVLSPEETAKELPDYPGFGVIREQIEEVD